MTFSLPKLSGRKTLSSLAIFFSFILFLFPASTSSQTQPESSESLVIQHQQKEGRQYSVNKGKKIKVRTYNGEKIKGRLTAIYADTILIDDRKVAVSEIQSITARGAGSVAAKATGIVVMLAGLLGFVLGLIVTALGFREAEELSGCGAIFVVIILVTFGVALAGGGLIVFLLGLIPFGLGFAAGKRFRLDKKWKIRRDR